MYLTNDLVLVNGTVKDVKIAQVMHRRKGSSYASQLVLAAVTALIVTGLFIVTHLITMDLAAQGRDNAGLWFSYVLTMGAVVSSWTCGIYTAYRLVRYELPYRQLRLDDKIIDLGADLPSRRLIVAMLGGSHVCANLWLAECGKQHTEELYGFITNEQVVKFAHGLFDAYTDQLRLSIVNATIPLLPPALQPSFAAHAARAKDMARERNRRAARHDAALERDLGIK